MLLKQKVLPHNESHPSYITQQRRQKIPLSNTKFGVVNPQSIIYGISGMGKWHILQFEHPVEIMYVLIEDKYIVAQKNGQETSTQASVSGIKILHRSPKFHIDSAND